MMGMPCEDCYYDPIPYALAADEAPVPYLPAE